MLQCLCLLIYIESLSTRQEPVGTITVRYQVDLSRMLWIYLGDRSPRMSHIYCSHGGYYSQLVNSNSW